MHSSIQTCRIPKSERKFKRNFLRSDRSSSGGKSKKVLNAEKKKKERGAANERRLAQIVVERAAQWPDYMIGFYRATEEEDKTLAADAWCLLKNELRIPIQVKSSARNLLAFIERVGDAPYATVVVNQHRSDEYVFSSLMGSIRNVVSNVLPEFLS